MTLEQAMKDQLDAMIQDAQDWCEQWSEAQYIKGQPLRDLHDLFIRAFDAAVEKAAGHVASMPSSLDAGWR